MGPLLRMQTKLHFEVLPENVQVQYLQKIALRAENKAGPMRSSFFREIQNKDYHIDQLYFLRKQFSAAIEAAHFPDLETGY